MWDPSISDSRILRDPTRFYGTSLSKRPNEYNSFAMLYHTFDKQLTKWLTCKIRLSMLHMILV